MSALTLSDLLQQFLAAHPQLPAAMFRTTANHLAHLLGHEHPQDVVLTYNAKQLPELLEQYLRTHARASASKVRNNKTQAKAMIHWGMETGLIPSTLVRSAAWDEVWTQKRPIYGTIKGGAAFLHYCLEHGIEPAALTAAHFHEWRIAYEAIAMQVKPANIVRTYVSQVRALLRANSDRFPCLVIADLDRVHPLRIPFDQWSVPLQQEYRELKNWLTRPRLLGRRGRPWTPKVVRDLQGRLGELYGFATRKGLVVQTLGDLMAQTVLHPFLLYKFEEKNNSARSILSYVTYFRKVLEYLGRPASWLQAEIIDALPSEDLEIRPVPRHTVPPYSLLEELPTRIDQAIQVLEKKANAAIEVRRDRKRVRIALLWRLKLVFLFLLYLSWRISNITQLRLGTPKDLARYQAPSCTLRHGLLYYAPAARRWRFFFPASATKNGRVVQGEIPAVIVPTLERYLKDFRPLLRPHDPTFLFPSREGKLSDTPGWSNIIKHQTFRYLKVAVGPHKFRHAFAFHYLTQCPEDYLTLSRYLWHRSVEITIQIYGGFEPEDALRRVESWRDAHRDVPVAFPTAERAGTGLPAAHPPTRSAGVAIQRQPRKR